MSMTVAVYDVFLALACPTNELAHGPYAIHTSHILPCRVCGDTARLCDVVNVDGRKGQRVRDTFGCTITGKVR